MKIKCFTIDGHIVPPSSARWDPLTCSPGINVADVGTWGLRMLVRALASVGAWNLAVEWRDNSWWWLGEQLVVGSRCLACSGVLRSTGALGYWPRPRAIVHRTGSRGISMWVSKVSGFVTSSSLASLAVVPHILGLVETGCILRLLSFSYSVPFSFSFFFFPFLLPFL